MICPVSHRRAFVVAAAPILALAVLPWLGSCASAPQPAPPAAPPATVPDLLDEQLVPDGAFREHRLARCAEEPDVPAVVEKYLGLCSEYFRDGSGSDGMIELELGLAGGHRDPLMLITLGQLYLLAGQGNPDLLPYEGPAADVGSYVRNKPRLLRRARDLLLEALPGRPDDAAIEYLLADVARTMGHTDQADSLVTAAHRKCTGGRTFRILQMYQDLYQHPPRYLGGPAANYPRGAIDAGLEGEVVLDLLLSPAGEVRQYEVTASPGEALTRAAWESVQRSRFEPGRVGKYAVWSWLRITTPFALGP